MRPLGERIATLESEVVNIKDMLEQQNENAAERDKRLQRIERLLYLLLGGLLVVEFILKAVPQFLGYGK